MSLLITCLPSVTKAAVGRVMDQGMSEVSLSMAGRLVLERIPMVDLASPEERHLTILLEPRYHQHHQQSQVTRPLIWE